MLLALLVLHRAKLLASNQSILALGRSPRTGRQPFVPLHLCIDSHLCRCICASTAICAVASCNGFVWLTASILAWTRGGSPTLSPARTPGVYAQRLCTMQSQLSIHSPSPRGRGFRQGCRNKDTPSFKHGCLQVVEQSRCRTHRQQTTTIAETQSHQSVLKGIGIINQKLISKTGFSYPIS